MDRDVAKKLVQETLQDSFDKGCFTFFAKNLLNHVGETPQAIYRDNYIPDIYKPYINAFECIGKYEDPEKEPYLYISWKYKCKDDGVDFEVPDDIDDKMNKATEHHVKSNKHHPESHCKKKIDLINREDRDKPPEEIIDATEMPELDIGEMVGDWLAMSEEKGGSTKDWADKNVNVRWKFTDDQKDLIYELIKELGK